MYARDHVMPDTDVQETTSAEDLSGELTLSDFETGGVETTSVPAQTDAVQAADSLVAPVEGSPQSASPTAEAAAQWQSIREAAGQYGYQFPETVADDRAALQHLIDQVRQQQLHAELGRQLAPKAGELRTFFEQQAKPPAPERKPWDPPEGYDPRYLGLCTYDEATGLAVGKPGTPTWIVDKVNEQADYLRKMQDPAVQTQMIDYRAELKARELVDQRFNELRQQTELREIERRNAGWLYQRDAQGSAMVGRDGQPVLSVAGARYLNAAQMLRQYGVSEPNALDALARQIAAGQLAYSHLQQAQATQPAQQRAPRAATTPSRNVLQSLTATERRETPGATEPRGETLSLHARLMKDMADEGVTDDDIARSLSA